MLNADKSIKNATDSELQEMLSRVRQEREALRLIRGVKLLSEPNQKGPYPNYSTLEAFSTETPVNNGKSIKEMSNEELVYFLQRLRNEEDLMRVVRDIKEMNNPTVSSEDGVYFDKGTYEGIDLNTPVKDLYHHGVPGMRWGVRRSRSALSRASNTKKSSEDYQKSRDLVKKGSKQLSTSELKEVTQRLQLETSYSTLAPSDYKKAKKIVKEAIDIGKTLSEVYSLIQSPAGQAVIGAFKKSNKGG